jgi:hypothetical protein
MNPKLYSWLIIVCQTQFHVNICLLFHSISLLHLHENAFQSLQQRQDLPLVTFVAFVACNNLSFILLLVGD